MERTGGFKTVAFCEIEPYCRAVLRKHWPVVPIFEDVRKLTAADVSGVDVICGGFPCQDISYAGAGAGLSGARSGLWREYARLVGELRPRYVIVENVAALTARGLLAVLGDFAALGFDAEWHCIPASSVGAPHRRDRVWIIAYPNGQGGEGLVTSHDISSAGAWGWDRERDLQTIVNAPFEPTNRWPQPLLRKLDDGVLSRLDRTKCAGNAVVPQIPEIIGRAILQFSVSKPPTK